jgi:hypothetical protein
MIRRLAPAAAVVSAALAGALCCAAGSLWRQATLVAGVNGDSTWTTLNTQRSTVLQTWRSSLTPRDWLLFSAAGLLAAALVARHDLAAATRRLGTRFATPRRRTE